jgi:bleomycin hydrolase
MIRYLCLAVFGVCLSGSTIAQYKFTQDIALACGVIQDQQSTNTCWSFATSSFLESELLRTGKAQTNLSEMYVVRQIYLDKARNYILRQGKANFAEGGLAHDVTHALAAFGAMPESAYPGRASMSERLDHHELSVVLKSVLDAMLSKKAVSEKWPEVVNAILDVYIGPLPEHFKVDGEMYTPTTYAAALDLNMDDYVSLTSFTHHPYYKPFVLEIPDNHANGSFYNIPIDELMRVTRSALETGYTISWDGDVSEKSFGAQQGIAVNPLTYRDDVFTHPGQEVSVTQDSRQLDFEVFSTTDDHLMHVTGMARDQRGTAYFIVKNSWGEIGPYRGFLYMSESYYKAKTISIMVHRDAIPADIAGRLAL